MKLGKDGRKIFIKAKQDSKEFARIFDHYFPGIYNYVYFRVRKQQLAEDITSKAFHKAYSDIKYYSGDALTTWLYTIARQEILKHLPIEAGEEKDLKISQDCEKEQLLRLIGGLTAEQQDALILRYQQELSEAEIAQIINEPEPEVVKHIYSGLKKLKILMGDEREKCSEKFSCEAVFK